MRSVTTDIRALFAALTHAETHGQKDDCRIIRGLICDRLIRKEE